MDTNPKHTLEILELLKGLGFNDEAFSHMHHMKGEKIASFERYCRRINEFKPDDNNSRVHQRLDLVLKAYSAGGFKSGKPEVFRALAEAATAEIPIPQKY